MKALDPRLRVVTLALLVGGAFLVVALNGSLSADGVRDRVDGLGAAGPLLFIPISAGLTLALFPGPLLAGASGLLFGTALGTPVSIVSATLGATLAFCLSRWWAHDAVEAIAGPRLGALRVWVGRRGFLSVLYARIAPGVPYSLRRGHSPTPRWAARWATSARPRRSSPSSCWWRWHSSARSSAGATCAAHGAPSSCKSRGRCSGRAQGRCADTQPGNEGREPVAAWARVVAGASGGPSVPTKGRLATSDRDAYAGFALTARHRPALRSQDDTGAGHFTPTPRSPGTRARPTLPR